MRKKFLNIIAYLSVSYTWCMAIGILLLTLFLGYCASTLKMRTGFDNLLPSDNPRITEYNFINDEFQSGSNIMLIAKGAEDSLKSYAEAVKPLLEDFDDWVSSVHIQIPEDFYRRNALKLLSADQLDNFGPMFYDPNLIPFLKNLNNSFEKEYQRDEGALKSRLDVLDAIHFLDGLEIFIDIQNEIMKGESFHDIGQKAVDAITFGETYKLSYDKDMMIIMIQPAFNMLIDPEELHRNINGIEKIIKDASIQYGVTAGILGSLVLERDKYEAFTFESWKIYTLTLIGITILFVCFFRMWGYPLLVIIAVIFGVIWAMGVFSFFVEYLNMMTAMLSIVLIGLGNEFSLHMISGYIEKRNQGLDVVVSIQETLLQFGPGIITGGSTAVLVFQTLIFFETKGIKDMGNMVSVGIVVTMLAILLILPVILVIYERILKKINISVPTNDVSYRSLGKIANLIAKYRLVITIIVLFSTGILFKHAREMMVDYNYLNMEPVREESIQLQDELIETFNLSSDIAMFTTDNFGEVQEFTKRAREMKTIGWVESISDYLPDSGGSEKQYRYLQDLRRKLKNRAIRNQMSSHDLTMYRKEIERLEGNIIELQDMAYLYGKNRLYEKAVKLVGEAGDSIPRGNLTQFINSIDTEFNNVELTYFQQKFSKAFISTVMTMANTEPLTLFNLPVEIKNRFIGKSADNFIINIYPKKNIWKDTRFLNSFIYEITELSDKVTGSAPIFVNTMDILIQKGQKATYLAFIAIFLALLLDFRSLKYALIGMLPFVFGIIWMIGVMELSGLDFTMMNLLALPLIICIGIDNGVHILHRWKIEKNLDIVYRSTGKAILLVSISTMLGFGSLWFITYRGLESAGITLFIGVGTCFLATLIVIPIMLGLDNKS